jgi:hypothetical protein
MRANIRHYSMIVVDVVGFSQRDDRFQRRIRGELKGILADARSEAGIPDEKVVTEDRGDGKLILVSGDVPAYHLIDPMVARLDVGLRQHNEAFDERAAIRLRMALHQGQAAQDADGWVGSDVNTVFRLADCQPLRSAVESQPDARLFLIVSDTIRHSIVRHGHGAIEPATYRQVAVTNKETSTVAWIHVPGSPQPGDASGRSSNPEPNPAPPPPASIGGAVFQGTVIAGGDIVGRDKYAGGPL